MVTDEQMKRIIASLPMVQDSDDTLQREFQRVASLIRIPRGHEVFTEGDPVESIALLISGVVRVYKISEGGREITLYRFGNGESCILTANAILSQKNFPAIAIVEKEAEAVLIPSESFRAWVNRYESWRDFVFDLLSNRLSGIMEIVEEIAFHRMDSRLASILLKQAGNNDSIFITHQKIASELGSSREVISRLLEDFNSREIINVSRGTIEILNKQTLMDLAGL
jgi:CRP/FNR family transcriptional regulator, anaerobic regulatory protein